MALTERERKIGAIVAAAAVLYAGWEFAASPYLDRRDQIAAATRDAQDRMAADLNTFTRQRKLRPAWANIQQSGLKADTSAAESQALHAVLAWAQSSGVTLASLRPERTTKQGPFQVVSFGVNVTGPMRTVAKVLWAIETPGVPIRLDSVQIKSRKDGTDDLSAELSVSTICLPPAPAKPANGGGTL